MNESKRILLVEDQKILAKLMSFELIDVGHKVTLAYNGREALTLLEKTSFDIMITDLFMPEMGGIELIEEVKKQKMDLPIIVLSASHKGEVKTQLSALGVEQFLDKPITDEKMALLLHLINVM
jgi:CheY-like chemotaxis protein